MPNADRAATNIPIATYRFQLSRSFTFWDAAKQIDYLHRLGISHVYLSPFLTARPGSDHGYDVLDHSSLNPELGGEAGFNELRAQLEKFGMRVVMDIVPNHMCITQGLNPWWNDVLENGPSSEHAHYFDIDWNPPKPELKQKVLLAVLGDQFGRVLENQELRVEYHDGLFSIVYYEHRFPVAPKSELVILEPLAERLRQRFDDSPPVMELESIIFALQHLPGPNETRPELVRTRYREKEVIRGRLAALTEAERAVAVGLDHEVETLNGTLNQPESFDRLERMLAMQSYRLSYWRVASDEINYRRFFDINELAAIRVEEPPVFEAVHAVAFKLIADGLVTGLRIDHVDGLFDPEGYLSELSHEANTRSQAPIYLVVEKILSGSERLPENWPIHGTTGYDFLSNVNGVFVATDAERAFLRHYQSFTGQTLPFRDQLYRAKKLILHASLSSELHVLAHKLDHISEQQRWSRDFTFNSLLRALTEVIACFPVYRTYLRPHADSLSALDRAHVLRAVAEAKRRNPTVSRSIFEFLAELLVLSRPQTTTEQAFAERKDFVLRLQQLTGPVMAKGLEDTTFYRYFPLSSLNEVGGEPLPFGRTLDQFHRFNEERLDVFPAALSATTTHDTKRGEDLRLRLNVLSEIPGEWWRAVRRLSRAAAPHKQYIEDDAVPSANEEYLIYQTLVGIWPENGASEEARLELEARLRPYVTKALRESKLRTSWVDINEEYEQAVDGFVQGILRESTFLSELEAFVREIAQSGYYTSLNQLLLKLTAPGVPDFYQGSEFWNFSLVDPDNRRPVDYASRREGLERLDALGGDAAAIRELAGNPSNPLLKLALTRIGLRLRQRLRRVFDDGAYLRLRAEGASAECVIAFARSLEGKTVVVAAARFLHDLTKQRAPIGQAWADTVLVLPEHLADKTFIDRITERRLRPQPSEQGPCLPMSDVYRSFPLALLEAEA